MGFIGRSRDKFRLRSALKRLKKKPTPQALCELVQCHVSLSDLDRAFQYSSWGQKRFPRSELVLEMHRIVVRERAQQSLLAAQAQVAREPTTEAFMNLARYALQLRDGARALQALEECVARFPDNVPALHALADITERRYLRDLGSEDGTRVISLLRHGWERDPAYVQWWKLLGRFYQRLGAIGMARAVAEDALQRGHATDEARESLAQLPLPNEDEADDIDSLLHQIEEQGFLPGFGEESLRVQREVVRLRGGLKAVSERIGAVRSLVLVREGEAYDESGPVPQDAFVGLASNLLRSSQVAGRRAGLGPLRGATLETDGGAIVLRRGYRSTVACLLPEDTSIRGSQETLGSLVTSDSAAVEKTS